MHQQGQVHRQQRHPFTCQATANACSRGTHETLGAVPLFDALEPDIQAGLYYARAGIDYLIDIGLRGAVEPLGVRITWDDRAIIDASLVVQGWLRPASAASAVSVGALVRASWLWDGPWEEE